MLRGLKQFLRRIFGSNPAEPPKDPNAPVGAPKKPKRPQQSGAVALAEPEED